MKKFWLLFLVWVLSLVSTCAAAREADPVNTEDIAYFAAIHDAVLGNDRDWLANEIVFPIHASIHGHAMSVKTKKQFLDNYDEIINAYVRNSVSEQNSHALFKNWQGLMIGRGAIWFMQIKMRNTPNEPWVYHIVAVNNAPP